MSNLANNLSLIIWTINYYKSLYITRAQNPMCNGHVQETLAIGIRVCSLQLSKRGVRFEMPLDLPPSPAPLLASLEVFLSTSFETLLCFIVNVIRLFWGPISQIKTLTRININFPPSLLCFSPDLLRFLAQNIQRYIYFPTPNPTWHAPPHQAPPANSLPMFSIMWVLYMFY